MAALLSSSPPPPPPPLPFPTFCSLTSPNTHHHHHFPLFHQSLSRRLLRLGVASSSSSSSQLCPPLIDKSSLVLAETSSEDQLWAAACLRVRSFYQFNPSTFGLQDHKRYLAEREFEALKERVAGKRTGFKKVSCINATLPLSHLSSLLIHADDEDVGFDLCTQCKFSDVGGEDRVVVGTLDLNQCLSLPDEITGSKPEGIGADFARAYLSNVCVAKELHKNGLGYEVVGKAKVVAQGWGISDLYVHVAIDNEPAKRLYMKSGFVYEKDEPAWQARFLDRPRRLLLWIGLSSTLGL